MLPLNREAREGIDKFLISYIYILYYLRNILLYIFSYYIILYYITLVIVGKL